MELLVDESHISTVGENGGNGVGAHSDAHFQLVGLDARELNEEKFNETATDFSFLARR